MTLPVPHYKWFKPESGPKPIADGRSVAVLLPHVSTASVQHTNSTPPAMKHLIRFLAASALLTTISPAAPFLAIGDNAEVFLTGTLGVRADSNIFLTPNERSDTIFDVNPGAQLVFGQGSVIQGTWTVTDSITTYADHDDLNSNLFSTAFNAAYDDGKSKSSVNVSFSEINQNTVDTVGSSAVDALIRRDVFGLGGLGEVNLTEKSSVSAGLQYQNTDYKRLGFSDTKVVTLPVSYYYELTPKVDVSFNYRYRQSWLQHGYDSKDNFLGVGARGEFTPKVKGQFSVGITQRNFGAHKGLPDLDDKSLFGVDSSLTYEASPKTMVQFGVSNDFDANSQGQQQKNFAVRASAFSNISEVWSLTAGVSYRAINYYLGRDSRTDDYMEAQIGATYTVDEYLRITAALAFRTNKSDLSTSDFDNNVLSLAANLRF